MLENSSKLYYTEESMANYKSPIDLKMEKRAAERLAELNFDPIGALINKYSELEEENEVQKGMRDGRVVKLRANGSVMPYRPDIHMSVFDKQIMIAEKLLRFGYARVTETNVIENKPSPNLVINLTKKGDSFEEENDDV